MFIMVVDDGLGIDMDQTHSEEHPSAKCIRVRKTSFVLIAALAKTSTYTYQRIGITPGMIARPSTNGMLTIFRMSIVSISIII